MGRIGVICAAGAEHEEGRVFRVILLNAGTSQREHKGILSILQLQLRIAKLKRRCADIAAIFRFQPMNRLFRKL